MSGPPDASAITRAARLPTSHPEQSEGPLISAFHDEKSDAARALRIGTVVTPRASFPRPCAMQRPNHPGFLLVIEGIDGAGRSADPTSEFQSHSKLVCRLLLRKSTRLNSRHTATPHAGFCLKTYYFQHLGRSPSFFCK